MGLQKFRHQCRSCVRLPRSPEEEDYPFWFEPGNQPAKRRICLQYQAAVIEKEPQQLLHKEGR